MKNKKALIFFLVFSTLFLEVALFYNYFNFINLQKEKGEQILDSLNKDEINKDSRSSDNYNEIYYDIIIKNCDNIKTNKNGTTSDFKCEFINSVKKKKYSVFFTSSYNDIKNRAVIKIADLNNNDINKVLDKNQKTNFEKLSNTLDNNINGDYKINLIYQSIKNVKYDILVSKKIRTLRDDNGDNGTEYVYELVNTIEKLKYDIYCDNYVDFYNDNGTMDKITVDVTRIDDNELSSIIKENKLESSLKDLKDLIKSHFPDNYKVDINYINE